MKILYDYFLSTLHSTDKIFVKSFIKDCKLLNINNSCSHIIKKYNLLNSNFDNEKNLIFPFFSGTFNVSLFHDLDSKHTYYSDSAVEFLIEKKLPNQSILEFKLIYEIPTNSFFSYISVFQGNSKKIIFNIGYRFCDNIMNVINNRTMRYSFLNEEKILANNLEFISFIFDNFKNLDSQKDTIFLTYDVNIEKTIIFNAINQISQEIIHSKNKFL